MAWYSNHQQRTHVATYTSQWLMRQEIETAAKYGWKPQVQQVEKKLVVTYTRTEADRAQAHIGATQQGFDRAQAQLTKADQALGQYRTSAVTALSAARGKPTDPIVLERYVQREVRRLVNGDKAAISARQRVLRELDSLQRAYQQAAHNAANAPSPSLDIPALVSSLQSQNVAAKQRVTDSLSLLEAQAAVVRAVTDWQRSVGRRWRAIRRSTHAARRVEAASGSDHSSTHHIGREHDGSPSLEGGDESSKHHELLDQVNAAVNRQEQQLVAALRTRDHRVNIGAGEST